MAVCAAAATNRATWIFGLAGTAALLALYGAETMALIPACPFLSLTGLYCPGCGSTRALHALVHGDPLGALGFNALMVSSLPAVLPVLLAPRASRLGSLPGRLSPAAIYAMLGVIALFWILRNIDRWPLSVLAP